LSFKSILLIFIGGGLGSIVRYYLSHLMNSYQLIKFNLGTLSVNVIGSFFIGLILGYVLKSQPENQNLISFAVIGFCGGFTTFSSFSYDNFLLLKQGDYLQFLIYAVGSLVVGLLAVAVGFLITKF
jgi:CrcB protein